MKRSDKQRLVEELQAKVSQVGNLILAEYRGMTVEQMTDFRKRVRSASGSVQVVKNTLARRAVSGTDKAALLDMFKGPNAFIFGYQDPVVLAKVVAGVSKEVEALRLKGGVVEGRTMSADEILQVAKLPSRDELISRVLGSLTTPMRGLLNVCHGSVRSLVYVLEAIRHVKAKAAGT